MQTRIGEIDGVYYYSPTITKDERGDFSKFFCSDWMNSEKIHVNEIFVTNSYAGSIRGLHLQVNESASNRIISVQEGEIFDVLLDLRKDSQTFLTIKKQILCLQDLSTVFVPKGVAHGFQAIQNSRVIYLSDYPYRQEDDTGVDALSLEIDWPIKDAVRSSRDTALPSLAKMLDEMK